MQHFESAHQRTPFPPNVVNPIQMELIEQSHEDPVIWIEKHSSEFRTLIEQHPEVVALYAENQVEGIKAIKQLLEDLESKKDVLH